MNGYSQTYIIYYLSTLVTLLKYCCLNSLIAEANVVNISQILDSLVDNTTYNRQLRPQFGGKPTEVTVSIRVSTISCISEVDMDFTVDLYLRQMWNDPRLAFFDKYELPIEEIQPITVGLDYLSLLWRPDTFFPNAKQTNYHSATTRNLFLRIDPSGNVFTSERLTVTAVCLMDLRLYPMDTQKCKLEIESYGYSITDIIYSLEKSTNSITVESFELPQFQFIESKSLIKTEQTSSGKYSRLICIFLLKRNIGFYVIQIYLPSVLIVTLSWVSFWLDQDATPARVTLGVLTVLTMTTLITTSNSGMPKVSYFKSIDIFLGVSFVLVFSALVEYAAVSYIQKQSKTFHRHRKCRRVILSAQQRSFQIGYQSSPTPSTSRTPFPAFPNSLYYPFYSSQDENSSLHNKNLRIPVRLKEGECQCPIPPLPSDYPRRMKPTVKNDLLLKCCSGYTINLSHIDQYSRLCFPLVFFVFNIIYWIYFYHISRIDITDSDFS